MLTQLRSLPLYILEVESAGQGALPVAVEGLPPAVGPQLPEHRGFEGLHLQTVVPSWEVQHRPLHQVRQPHDHLLWHRDDLMLKRKRK